MGRTSAIARLMMEQRLELERLQAKRYKEASAGRWLGGRPPKSRRCTKRLGTRLCWNWRESEMDRCRLHVR